MSVDNVKFGSVQTCKRANVMLQCSRRRRPSLEHRPRRCARTLSLLQRVLLGLLIRLTRLLELRQRRRLALPASFLLILLDFLQESTRTISSVCARYAIATSTSSAPAPARRSLCSSWRAPPVLRCTPVSTRKRCRSVLIVAVHVYAARTSAHFWMKRPTIFFDSADSGFFNAV